MATTERGGRARAGRATAGALMLFGLACGAPAPARAPEPAEAESMAVFAVSAPDAVTIDGQLDEWGDLRPVRREPPEVDARRGLRGPPDGAEGSKPRARDDAGSAEDERPVLPNLLVGDASRVAVAITQQAVWVVGELEDTTAEAIWLGLGADPPAVPEIGWNVTAGSGGELLPCAELAQRRCAELRCDGASHSVEEQRDRCEDARILHAQLVARHAKRFHKLVRIERRAAFEHEARREAGGKPLERPLDRAEIAWTRDAHRARFEARLPLDALPRLGEAPLRSLNLYARTARRGASVDEAIATMPPARWWRSYLPIATRFEPLGELREALFAEAEAALSYHPASPGEIELIEADHERAEQLTGPLFKRVARFGAFEVGRARAAHDHLVVQSHEGLRALVDLDRAGPTKALERAGELHVITPLLLPTDGGLPRWSALAIAADGSLRDLLAGVGREAAPPRCARFDDARLLPEQRLERFGVRGECVEPSGGKRRTLELEYRWDPRRASYQGGVWQPPPGR